MGGRAEMGEALMLAVATYGVREGEGFVTGVWVLRDSALLLELVYTNAGKLGRCPNTFVDCEEF